MASLQAFNAHQASAAAAHSSASSPALLPRPTPLRSAHAFSCSGFCLSSGAQQLSSAALRSSGRCAELDLML
jgi:hypothetical protein